MNSGISIAGLFALLVLVALVWTLATWRRRGHLARSFAFLIGIVLVLMTAYHFVGFRRVRVNQPAVVSRQIAPASLEDGPRGGGGGELDRDVTDGLEPDVYPSVRSAVVASTRGLLKDLIEVVPDGAEVHEVLVTGVPDDLTRADLASLIGMRLPTTRVLFDAVVESQPAESSRVTLRVESPMGRIMSDGGEGGQQTVKVALTGAAAELSRHVRVTLKQWVEDLPAFRARVGRGPWLVADPQSLAATREEALTAATQHAAGKLHPQVFAWAARRPDFNTLAGGVGRDQGRQLIEVELANGGLIRDAFIQQFDRGYGQVYRAALLLDVSDAQMQRLADAYVSTFGAQRTRLRQSVLSGGGLILVILLVYWFLNAATKGYYVWSVRVACTMLLVAGIFTLFVLA